MDHLKQVFLNAFESFLKQVLSNAFESFLCVSILMELSVFCLGEKQGMLANNECNSWYNRVVNFLASV